MKTSIKCLYLIALMLAQSSRAYDIATHRALSNVAVRKHPESKVAEVVINQLGYEKGLLEEFNGTTLLANLEQGAEDEDSYAVFRFFNHFYDPIFKSGLHDGGVGTDALDWAWDNAGEVFNADYGWKHTRALYFSAVSLAGANATEDEALDYLCETFVGLGHCIHLIQDMAQPQHTRNDAHPVHPYEDFCRQHYGTPDQILTLPFFPVPHPTIPSQSLCGDKPPEFVAFWDTFQLSVPTGGFLNRTVTVTSPLSLNPATLGMAEISNGYFVTDDTMFTGELAGQVIVTDGVQKQYWINFETADSTHTFPFPKLRQLSGLGTLLQAGNAAENSAIRAIRSGEAGPLHSNLETSGTPLALRGAGLGICSDVWYDDLGLLVLGLTDRARLSHATNLLPRAVAFSTGLVNYFFRGRLIVKYTSAGAGAGNIEVTNDSYDSIQSGTFYVIERTGSGSTFQSRLLKTFSNSQTLQKGDKLLVALSGVSRGEDLRVVFQGTLGTEIDIAVAVGRYCGIPQTDSSHLYTLVDFGVVPASYTNDTASWGLNIRNQILGFHQSLSGFPVPTGGGGFVWTDLDGDCMPASGEEQFVGGNPATLVKDINDLGVVAGTAYQPDGKVYLAKWKPMANGQYDNPELGGPAVGGLTINNLNTILDPILGVLWEDGETSTNLAFVFTNEFSPASFRFEAALDLDDRGRLLVRVTKLSNGQSLGSDFMIWTRGGGLKDTGLQGGALGILNNAGKAALLTYKAKTVNGITLNLPNVVIWDESTGQIWDLDTSMSLFDLNDCGQLAGYSAAGSANTPFLWDNQTGLRNLNTLVELPPGISLTHVLKLNCNGKILALGLNAGQRHVYLLSPPAQ